MHHTGTADCVRSVSSVLYLALYDDDNVPKVILFSFHVSRTCLRWHRGYQHKLPGCSFDFRLIPISDSFSNKKRIVCFLVFIFNEHNQQNSLSLGRAMKNQWATYNSFYRSNTDNLVRPVAVAFFLWPTFVVAFGIGVRLSIPVHFFQLSKHGTVLTSPGEKSCEVVENSFFDFDYDTTRLRLVSEINFNSHSVPNRLIMSLTQNR